MGIFSPFREPQVGLNTKLCLIASSAVLITGLVITSVSFFVLFLRGVWPVLMMMYPWFFVWDVPRKFFMEQAPDEYVYVFGWGGVIYNFIHVLMHAN